LTSQDWAAWVQALGSIAALVGVGWTVKTQERYRKDEATAKAIVVAASQTLHLATVSGDIRAIQVRFDEAKQFDCPPELFSELLARLEDIPTWNADELSYLAALPNKISFKVAGGIDRLNSVIFALQKTAVHPDLTASADFRKYQASFFSFVLNESALLFNAASTRMQLLTLGPTGPYE
jgi:hypothetical protein